MTHLDEGYSGYSLPKLVQHRELLVLPEAIILKHVT